MNVTQVKVFYSYTYNLGDYSNVKPMVELVADLDEGENVDEALANLNARAVAEVQRQIDLALEADNQAPRFFNGPRFGVVKMGGEKMAAIVPSAAMWEQMPGEWAAAEKYFSFNRRRYEVAKAYCARELPDWTVFDCSDNTFAVLPLIEKFQSIRADFGADHRYLALVPYKADQANLPDGWNTWRTRWELHTRIRDNLVDALQKKADDDGCQFIDCSDGDLSKLPELPKPEPEPEPEPDYDDDYDDDYDEEYDD